jgi:hypothetical protein
MTAAAAYYLRLLAYRQSAIPPVLFYLGLLALVFADDAGPPVPAATVTAAALMPLSAWLMRLTALSENRPFADVTAVALGGATKRLVARAAAAGSVGTALALVAVVWARAANPHPYRPAQIVAVVIGMHLAQVIAGIGIGALLAPPLRVTAGAAAIAMIGLVLLSLLVRWVPPLGPMLYDLGRTPVPGPVTLLLAIGQAAVLGGVTLTIAAVLGRRTS